MKYFKKEKEKLICLLCNHYCKLKENQVGICQVNKNVGEEIKNLVYGHIASLNLDPVEKKPLYHFLPSSKTLSLGTVGCNFKCPFCQNHSISQSNKINEKYFSPKDIVKTALYYGAKSISYTYNEPTIFYPYARDIAILAKENGLKNIFVSNGFESKEVIEDMKDLIDGINVDLKSFNKEYYKKELFGNLNIVLNNLKKFKQFGIWLEITTLIIPTKNDSTKELEEMASFISNELGNDTVWHLSAFHPDYKELSLPRTPFDTLKKAKDIANKNGLKYVYIGNVGYKNITYCPKCLNELIIREGFKVLKNNLNKDRCPRCNNTIQGVFL